VGAVVGPKASESIVVGPNVGKSRSIGRTNGWQALGELVRLLLDHWLAQVVAISLEILNYRGRSGRSNSWRRACGLLLAQNVGIEVE
jgi:hypothetical protein